MGLGLREGLGTGRVKGSAELRCFEGESARLKAFLFRQLHHLGFAGCLPCPPGDKVLIVQILPSGRFSVRKCTAVGWKPSLHRSTSLSSEHFAHFVFDGLFPFQTFQALKWRAGTEVKWSNALNGYQSLQVSSIMKPYERALMVFTACRVTACWPSEVVRTIGMENIIGFSLI